MKIEKISRAWQVTLITALNLLLLMSLSGFAATAQAAVRMGINGEWVMLLQERLTQEGCYNGKVDGSYSPATKRAVKEFQRSRGIEASGEADYQTLYALGLNSAHKSGYFSARVQLLAKFAAWKCGLGSYEEKLAVCQSMLERVNAAGYPDTLAANLLCAEFSDFCDKVYTIEPDTQSLRAAFACVG